MKNMRLFSQLIFVVSLSSHTLFFFSPTYSMTLFEELIDAHVDAQPTHEPTNPLDADVFSGCLLLDDLGDGNDIESFMAQLQAENNGHVNAAAAAAATAVVEDRPISPRPSPQASPDNSNIGQYLCDDPIKPEEPKKIDPKEPKKPETENGHIIVATAEDSGDTNETFQCPECGKHSASSRSLTNHRHIHKRKRNPEEYTCKKCKKLCKTPTGLKNHIRTCKANMANDENDTLVFECNECRKYVRGIDNLQRHVLESHRKNLDPQFTCPQCGKNFRSATSMNAHVYAHTEKKSEYFECKTCAREFYDPSSLKNHLVTCNPSADNNPKFPCQKCTKILLSAAGLRNHMRTHTMDPELEEDAYDHSDNGDDNDSLRNDLKFQCKECNQICKSAGGLAYHMHGHMRKREPEKYTCKICGKMSRTTTNLKEHVPECEALYKIIEEAQLSTGYREKKRPNYCESKEDGNDDDEIDDSSKKTVKKLHDGEKEFKCLSCKRFLTTRQSLRRHINSHIKSKISNCFAIVSNTPEKIVLKITDIRKLHSNGR